MAESNEYLSVYKMAEYLHIGLSTAYALIKQPGFPVVKISKGKYLIPLDELKKWMKQRMGGAK